MAERLVNVDRDTPMLLPVDLRQWVPQNDLVHFVVNAVETMNLSEFSVNSRGSGSAQYPPRMMLALVIYCYANGVFGSRRIERATYRDVAVRYLTGDTHPDHDSICKFRRENGQAVKEAFVEVLRLAKQMGVLKVGTVSVDGTHMKANASKHKSVRYDRAGELEQQLRKDIEDLLQRAEQSDAEAVSEDGQQLPEEIARREALLEKMRWAREELEKRAREKDTEQQKEDRPAGPRPGGGGPAAKPKDAQQINLTDPDSALMRKSHRDSYEQAL
jgi:transposase